MDVFVSSMDSDVPDFCVAGGSSSQDAVSKLEGKYCGLVSHHCRHESIYIYKALVSPSPPLELTVASLTSY